MIKVPYKMFIAQGEMIEAPGKMFIVPGEVFMTLRQVKMGRKVVFSRILWFDRDGTVVI
jgi:hypothetical protein